jgi:hypothetical protein
MEIHSKLRPGEPATEDGAKILLKQRFFDAKRYDLAKAGRFKFNKKLGVYNRLINRDLAEDLCDVNGEVIYEAGTHIGKKELAYLKSIELFEKGAHKVELNCNTELDDSNMVQIVKVYTDDKHDKVTNIIGTDLSITKKYVTIPDTVATFSYMMNIIERLDTHGLAPFSKELDLIKAYISIEDLRLENKLKSDYDIYISDFEVPPMSLEPLVEIAVKHNIAAKPGGGMVTIATRRLAEEGVQIKISDNGIGFDSADPDFDQTDLQNVRSRLKSELGAELTVNSAPGQDTEFTIVFYPNK